MRRRKLVEEYRQKLKQVSQYHVLNSLDLEILRHIVNDKFDFAVRSLAEFVND